MAGDLSLPSCIASLRTLFAVSAMQRLLGSLAPIKTAGSVHRRSSHPIANRFRHSSPQQLDCRPIPDHRLPSGSPTRASRGARSGAAAADVGPRLLAPSRLAWLALGFAAAFCSARLHGLSWGPALINPLTLNCLGVGPRQFDDGPRRKEWPERQGEVKRLRANDSRGALSRDNILKITKAYDSVVIIFKKLICRLIEVDATGLLVKVCCVPTSMASHEV